MLILFLLWGCTAGPEKQSLMEFKAENPEAVVYEHFVGEGDFNHALIHFRYTKGPSDKKLEEAWLYQRQKNKNWKLIGKEGPKPAGSKFGD
jgi:hypothetical protein